MEGIKPADDINVIKLQLRKPKSWNWQLTTSKSSPHIALPTIQLFNSKGQLLIEAKDHGMKRLSWSNNDRSKDDLNQVQRCRSDIIKNNHYQSIKSTMLDRTTQPKENSLNTKENRHLKKSKSEVLSKDTRMISQQHNSLKYKNGELNIRSRTEILEKLKKCSEESLKRAVADGYQKFLDFQDVRRSGSDSHLRNRRKSYTKTKSQYGTNVNDEKKVELNNFTHKRYKTRTSSAGTLIIDESFSNYCRKRPTKYGDHANNLGNLTTLKQQNHPALWRIINENPGMLFENSNVPDSNCNYIVQEPITPVRDNGNESGATNNEYKREKRKTKLMRRQSIDSTSSSAAEKRNRLKRKDDNNKGEKLQWQTLNNMIYAV